MVKPKVFIGSSKASVEVAHAMADVLEESAEVTVWDEDVFRLSTGFLQDLFAAPNQYDFAVMVWAPDDVTGS
ncbi:MAG TPA: TIR domain-containing protein, partial [Vicinamibacterales bacterium]|nr:TIR domain-containing protein [Vicinamibacterales bacterium]